MPDEDYDVTPAVRRRLRRPGDDLHHRDGVVTLLDLMPTGDDRADVVRRVTGVEGTVRMRHEWVVRLDYGKIRPWVTAAQSAATRSSRPSPARTSWCCADRGCPRADDHRHADEFDVDRRRRADVLDDLGPVVRGLPPAPDPRRSSQRSPTRATWVGALPRRRAPRDVVARSLLTLRLLTHERTGGIVAAPTTSLPEDFGGERNWDYRYCWLRDAALTLESLIGAGLHRRGAAVARLAAARRGRRPRGPPDHVRRRRLAGGCPRASSTHLPGYAGSRPVRIGNGAVDSGRPTCSAR